jgi:hypothetical protein
MSEEPQDEEQTQQTPTGQTIPVPKRDDVLRALENAAKPEKPRSRRRGRSPKQ